MKNNKTSRKNVLIFIISISLSLNVLFVGQNIKVNAQNKLIIKDYSQKQAELNIKLSATDADLEKIFDKYYSEKLQKFMDADDLMFLSQRQWNYAFTMNGVGVGEKTIYTEEKNLKFVLAELRNVEKILPQDILIKGSVTGGDPNDKLKDQISISSLAKYNKYEETEEQGTRICYEFKDIKSGTIITLKISEALKYRLNLQDNVIEIVVR